MRASAEFRLRGAGNLLRRFYLERSAQPPFLRTHEVQAIA
jgi:xanthine dehydrogenase iron-sulfur cluster and FAD-binding subunit A